LAIPAFFMSCIQDFPPMKRLALFPVAVLLLVCSLRAAELADSKPVAEAMAEAANQFLGSLNDEERAQATRDYDDPARLDWHNIPKDQRKGLQYREMSAAQRELCHGLLKSALSDEGYAKAVKIMSLESNLREGEKGQQGTPFRDPERYFLTVFGKPGSEGNWGWSFEGHHFSLNFAVQDGVVISDSPSFWGANPATVHVFIEGGPEVGTRTLKDEEQLAFDLLHSLDAAQLKKALIADKAPDDYRAAGQPQPPHSAPEGIAAADLTEAQQKTLWSLLETYTNHLEGPLAEIRQADIKDNDFGRVHFAWWGATKPGEGHYYRIQGPTFVLELVNIQSDPAGNKANHIHSVWRSLEGDFGVAGK
jgi:hypothetical protein